MMAVPFSLIGAFWLLWALDYNLSLAVAIGLIAATTEPSSASGPMR